MAELLINLPAYLSGHIILSVSAILSGLIISIPLGILATRFSRMSSAILGIASVIQTIPSMALLALMVPLLGGVIGFWPAFIALTLYSVLPILRNTVIGILELDPSLIRSANAMGMTQLQRLWIVELPLAAPMIVGGLRIAAVWVVGTATLATPVGAASLGNYIFSGLQTRNWASVLLGCFLAAILAILLDQIIRLLEVSLKEGRKKVGWTAILALIFVVLGGLTPSFVQSNFSYAESKIRQDNISERQFSNGRQDDLSGLTVIVGAKTFTEQFILSNLIAGKLRNAGANVEHISNMGSTILFDALTLNSVDVYVDYTGTIWATIMEREEPIGRMAMYIEVAHYLRDTYGILTLPPLGFQNAYSLAMTRNRAEELNIKSISDLGLVTSNLSIGGDPEFFARQEWIRVRDLYGLDFLSTRSMDSTFMYDAVRDGNVDLITAYTTDGRISAFDLVVLEDPKAAFPPYDAIVLLSPNAQKHPKLVRLLSSLSNSIDEELMRESNKKVDLDGLSPSAVAEFLIDKIK
ncbi:MAG: ABC transporter permease [Rhodospirillaceae bacterium]|nr:ABC transporter permease [Rhodospirillaceae bacterium]|tara:strand:- start:274 stop:1842 length:1569 start_codon:yes stop_codon:yes gene_type:complete